MTQKERDRLIALKKAKKKLITQREIQKAKPSADSFILNRGSAAVYSGANSIASALHLLNGRDPAENQSHFKPKLPTTPSKPDISILPGIGHFYFALTQLAGKAHLVLHAFTNNGKYIEEEKQVLERFLDSEQYFHYN